MIVCCSHTLSFTFKILYIYIYMYVHINIHTHIGYIYTVYILYIVNTQNIHSDNDIITIIKKGWFSYISGINSFGRPAKTSQQS